MSKTATTTAKKSFLSNKWLTNCFCAVSGCDFILAHTTLCCFYLITLCVYLYHRLYIKTAYRDCYIQSMTCTHKLLKATGAPAALLPFLPQPSEQQLFFCSVVCRCLTGEGGQGGAAGWGAEPQAEQPAAAGGVTEHGGPSHQSHRAAVQRQQALLASPPHVRARTEISRVLQIVQCGFFYARHIYFVLTYFENTHTYLSSLISQSLVLNPGLACWWGSMQINF